MKRAILAFSLYFMLPGCGNHSGVEYKPVTIEGQRFLNKVTYENSELKSEQLLTIDSLPQGYYKEYSHGELICLGAFREGKKDSTWVYYNITGKYIQRYENWFSGSQFGEQKELYPDGKIKKLTFFSLDKCDLFKMEFDTVQKVTNMQGFPLYVAYNKTDLNKGDVFDYMCFFGKSVPGYSVKIELAETDNKTKERLYSADISNDTLTIDLLFAKKYLKSKTYSNAGSYDWFLNYSLMDSAGNTKMADTMHIIVNVQ